MALQKEVALRDGKMLLFRLEAFNVFNHAQFFGAAAVNGNISSTVRRLRSNHQRHAAAPGTTGGEVHLLT